MTDPHVVVVGAGADGPAAAWRLADEHGVDVLLIEAGPFHGNQKWPEPQVDEGGTVSTDPDDLDGKLLDEQFSHREAQANDPTWGYLRVGPSNSARAPWFRNLHQNGFIWQVSAVGGTSIHYFGNHPRGYPLAFNDQPHWPIDYEDILPYYRLNEDLTSTQQAPMTAREEVFIEGVSDEQSGEYTLLTDKNVTEAGWRPQPNAIAEPGLQTSTGEPLDSNYEGSFSYDDGFRGDTLVGDHFQGSATPVDAPVREKARKSSNVGYVPRALDTNEDPSAGTIAIRPNTYVTDIHTTEGPGGGSLAATGVEVRDTWSGSSETIEADAVVLAAGCVESPRLWLNSDLPDDGWIGKGLTTHWFDWVVGTYDDETIAEINPDRQHMDPYVGQNSAVRFDQPGLGGLEDIGMSPGLVSFGDYLFTEAGYAFDTEVDPDEPWDTRGYIVGEELKRKMADYRQTKAILILTDDLPRQGNGVSLDDSFSDEHGPVPKVKWDPHPDDDEKRDELARIAADIHRNAGAEHIHRCEWPPLLLHMQSSMRIGKVLDAAGEAKNVDRLFVADHSALANGVGGPNPTNSGQANALRIADRLGERYFAGGASP